MKFGTQAIHSLIMVFVTKIAYVYCGDPKTNYNYSSQAQFIGLILLSNKEDRSAYSWLYNDEIMMLYIILCMYFAITNRPMWASISFTIGLSMKAGVLLLLPSFLG
jgi:Gpi18-like mannosyltransferase